jgi:hypothetical protein
MIRHLAFRLPSRPAAARATALLVLVTAAAAL